MILLLLSPGYVSAQSPAKLVKVGIALDSGGLNEDGFNKSAWAGAQRAAKEFNIKVTAFVPKANAQALVGRGAEPLASGGANLVIGVGFANTASVNAAAKNHGDVKFALVDDLPDGPNTAGLRFREQEGSFMVGYLAAKTSSTGVVGFVGGQDVPVIHKFQAGFTQGVKFVCPDCKVLFAYTGSTPAAWNNPARAKTLSAYMQARGADIIFTAAGGSGAGVIDQVNAQQCLRAADLPSTVKFRSDAFAHLPKSEAYKKSCAGDSRPVFFIGVDNNQNKLGDDDKNPTTLNHGLTSMVKRVDNVVYGMIRDFVQQKDWPKGEQSYGLENGGVGYALDTYNRALISPELEEVMKKVQRSIVTHLIKVNTAMN